MKWVFCVVYFILVLSLGHGDKQTSFRFANIFGDHMVLQQAPQRATIWGFGEVGQEVLVSFAGEMYRSLVIPDQNGDGRWSALLTPQLAGGPYGMEAYSVVNGAQTTISLKDILFGDVWICSGQSNMEFTVIQSNNGKAAINDSVNYPNIRVFTASQAATDAPLSELESVRQPWSLPSPATIGGPAWEYFSAVCWYYGIQLYKNRKYPIGLISTTWGGTPIEAWSSPDALKKCNISESRHELNNMVSDIPHNNSVLWNAMIYPFINMTIYGTVWYQGEENAEVYTNSYNCTFPVMIEDWRAKWYESTQQNTPKDFPFGFVQLSAVGNTLGTQTRHFAPLRWNQTCQYGYVPNNRQTRVFMAVAMDLGDPTSNYTSIHPADKTDVGNRLALAGLAIAYDEKVYYTGPLVSKITQFNSGDLLIGFGSLASDSIDVRSEDGFEVLCQGEWIAVKITDYNKMFVLVSSAKCKAEAVRYAWSDYPCILKRCAIYSGDLPSPPFIHNGPFSSW